VAAGRVLTYGELDERAGRLAGFLRTLGVGPETLVGVLIGSSPELVVGLLGILKAGAAYVPLDPSYPAERLSLMLAQTAAPVVLTQEALRGRLPDTRARVVCLDRDWTEIGRLAPAPAVRVEPDPAGGEVFAYMGLARQLGAGRPVYGLQAGLQAVAEGPASPIEELAARYLAAVREVQPEGPYLLAGWSLGAVIAYEMAQQIASSGGSVDRLAMIDPSPPGLGECLDETAFLAAFALDLVRLSGRQVKIGQEVLAGLDVETALDRLAELGRREGVLPPDVDTPRLRARFDLFRRHVQALEGYRPRPYEGPVTLVQAGAASEPASPGGWCALVRAEPCVLKGDHYSLLLKPALDRLVEHLERDLARAKDPQRRD